jgi:hypothetical protein
MIHLRPSVAKSILKALSKRRSSRFWRNIGMTTPNAPGAFLIIFCGHDRRKFLISRVPYWMGWAKNGKGGIINTGDSE